VAQGITADLPGLSTVNVTAPAALGSAAAQATAQANAIKTFVRPGVTFVDVLCAVAGKEKNR
jgi:hypothetical protein